MVRDDPYRRLAGVLEPVFEADRPDVLCQRIVAAASDLLPYDSLRVYEADAAAGELVPRVVRHPRFADAILRARIPLGFGLNGWSASRQEPVLVPQAQDHPRSVFIPGTTLAREAIMTIPLVARGRLVGHLNVQRYGGRPDLFSRDDFERLVRTDELTELANRRGLQEELDRAVALARRHGQPLALLLIDLDNFKRINDLFGHCAGDELLRHIARGLKERLRQGDLAARFGGDEFVIVLPQTDAAGAAVVACEMKEVVAEARISVGTSDASVSASVGFAVLGQGESSEALLDRADLLMYRAKRRSR